MTRGRHPNRSVELPHRYLTILLVGTLLIALVIWGLHQSVPFLRGAEYWLADVRIANLSPPQPLVEDIVILAGTEETLSALPQRSPLDRGFLSDLIRSLNEKKVRAIGLDILLDQPSEPEKDQRLLRALAESKVPITVAWVDSDHEKRYMTEPQRQFFHSLIDTTGVTPGIININREDINGVIRWMNLGESTDYGVLGFPLAIARSIGVDYQPSDTAIAYRAPPEGKNTTFITYKLRPKLLEALPPKEWIKGKIVLIGSIRPHEDQHRTPFATSFKGQIGNLSGVEIHAHALAQILEGYTAPYAQPLLSVILTTLLALLGLWIALAELSLTLKIALMWISIGLYWGIGSFGFPHGLPLVPLLAPTLAFLVTLSGTTALLGWHHGQQRRFLRKAFSLYVSPEIVARLEVNHDQLRLGGEKREMTFLFTDLEDFTKLSETIDPEQLSRLLRDYLDGMIEILFRHSGTLDKIAGDAITVIFGAPTTQPKHAELAVRCAVAMDHFAQNFAAKQNSLGIPFGRTRIGVNTGVASVGNYGSTRHFNYTAHGDAINTAARLEGANKYLGTRVCVGETTVKRFSNQAFRPIAELVVKGKRQAIKVFEPISYKALSSQGLQDYLRAYRLLEIEEIDQAKNIFMALNKRFPDDVLISLHAERLRHGATGTRIILESK